MILKRFVFSIHTFISVGNGNFPGGVKWLGCEVDHSLVFRAKVKNEWSCTSAYLSCLNGIDRGTFTLTFYKLL
jgi:hypothetical protein